ncbi:hypothetical protein ES703_97348 [subsurface metagenome]
MACHPILSSEHVVKSDMMQENIPAVADEHVGNRALGHGERVTEVGREERFVVGRVLADPRDMLRRRFALAFSEPRVPTLEMGPAQDCPGHRVKSVKVYSSIQPG